ncbi:MAG: aspartate ammonia-lyase [Firmicutes bacterium]|nr:aspartate ammonia-lyase [Bacillota bacterium]
MTPYRRERDLLGDRDVPQDVYYGIQTARAADNFPITGYKPHRQMIFALAHVKMAAAAANVHVNRLSPKLGDAIIKACTEILDGQFHDHFVVDVIQGGAGTSYNMNANEVIANRAIELLGGKRGDYLLVSPNTHVNMAQSTNDVFPTAIKIASLVLAGNLIDALHKLRQALLEKEQEFDGIIKMGRTHLQDAVPIRLGQEFGAYATALNRDIIRISQVIKGLEQINMGATAIGTGLNADVEYIDKVIELLAFNTGLPLAKAKNMVDATQNCDVYAAVSGALKVCAVNLSKMANDLRLLASGPRCGLNEINLPAMQPGSSIMPGKVNPVMAEVVNQVAFQVMGNDMTVTMAAEAGQLELNVMEPVLTFNLLQSLDILCNVVNVFSDRCVRGITANVQRCRKMVENSVGIITAINPHVGYETASAVAKEAITTGRPVREIVLERGILTEDELDIILNPQEMTKPGIAGANLLK